MYNNNMKDFNKSNIRNIAIIAHVDHGKTTLVDALMRQSYLDSRTILEERTMDSMALEKERGITIGAKITSVNYNSNGTKYKINIRDTPGHADFASEVDRSLQGLSGVVLVVDSYEGVMNQTKYVIRRAAYYNLPVIVFVNKVDAPKAQPERVVGEVVEFLSSVNESYFDSPVIYGSGRNGTCSADLSNALSSGNINELFETVIDHFKEPEALPGSEPLMLVSDLGVDLYLGRLLIGYVAAGSIKFGDTLTALNPEGDKVETFKVNKLFTMKLNKHDEVQEVIAGDVAVIAGSQDTFIHCTIGPSHGNFSSLPAPFIEKPSMCITIGANISPFKGKEGSIFNVNDIKNRLTREGLSNPGIRVKQIGETFEVYGRGELQLSVLIENMRREGFELCIGQPVVLTSKDENGNTVEPYQKIDIIAPTEFADVIGNEMRARKADLMDMDFTEDGLNKSVYVAAARNLIGLSTRFVGITKGAGTMSIGFEKWGEPTESVVARSLGVLLATEEGVVTPYALDKRRTKGTFFVEGGDRVYKNQIIGVSSTDRTEDLNVCEAKKLTNVRAAGSDDKVEAPKTIIPTIEYAMGFVCDSPAGAKDAYKEKVEVTPKSIRMFRIYNRGN